MSLNPNQGDLISVTTTVVLGDFSSPSVGKLKLRANTGGLPAVILYYYYTLRGFAATILYFTIRQEGWRVGGRRS